MSYDTLRQSLLMHDGLYYLNEDLELSGYVAYDVQWIRINRKSIITMCYLILIIECQ